MAEVNHFYAEQTTASTFSANNWNPLSNPCEISALSLSASTKYLIIAKAVLSGSNAGDDYGLQVRTLHDANIATRSSMRIQPTYTTSGEGKGYMFVGSFTTHPTTQTAVNFAANSFDLTDGYVDQLSLLLIDLDDLGSGNYVEWWNTASDPLGTTSWGDILCEIDYTELTGATEYLILGYSQIDVLDNKSNMHVRLLSGGTQMTYASEEGEISDELRIFGVMGREFTPGIPTSTDDIRIEAYADSANDWTKLYAYLIAIDTSAFDNFDYSFAATGQLITGTPASPSTLETISSFSPSNTADHLVLGRFNYTTAGNEARTSGDLILPSVTGGTSDQSNSSGTANDSVIGGSGTNEALGQSVQAGTTQTIYVVRLKLRKANSPTDNIVLKVRTGSMSGTIVGTSNEVIAATLLGGGADSDVDFLFPDGVSVTSGTTYYLELTRTGARDTGNNVDWKTNIGGDPYANGAAWTKNSGSWSEDTSDDRQFWFPQTTAQFVLLSGDIDTYQTQAWDPTDGETIQAMVVASLAPTSTTAALRGAAHASDSDPTSEYEFVAVLDLTLAAGGTTHSGAAKANASATVKATATVVVNGAAEANSATTAIAVGSLERRAASSVANALTLAASSVKEVTGSAAFSQANAISVSAVVEKTGAISANSANSANATAVVETSGSAAVSNALAVALTGAVTRLGSASASQAVALAASGSIAEVVTGAAAVPIASTVATQAAKDVTGAVSTNQAATVAASAAVGRFGSSSVNQSSDLAVSATVFGQKLGASSVPGAVALAVAGYKESFGSSSINQALDLAVSGSIAGLVSGAASTNSALTVGSTAVVVRGGSSTVPASVAVSSLGARQVAGVVAASQANALGILATKLSSGAVVAASASALSTLSQVVHFELASVSVNSAMTLISQGNLEFLGTAKFNQALDLVIAAGYVGQFARPDADISTTGWETAPVPSQSHYAQIDEEDPVDSDYVYYPA